MVENKRLVSVLGSTGSIGVNTLDVIGRHPDRFEVYALSAHTSVDTMLAQCIEFAPSHPSDVGLHNEGSFSVANKNIRCSSK